MISYYYLVTIAYDGSSYHGYAKQKNNEFTIQNIIEQVLINTFHQKIQIHGVSRTDRGVHAKNNIFGFELLLNNPIGNKTLKVILNENFPNDIIVKQVKLIKNSNFVIYKNIILKEYYYQINFDAINPFKTKYYWYIDKNSLFYLDKLPLILKEFIGEHNFINFITKDNSKKNQKFNFTIYNFHYLLTKSKLKFYIKGNGFGWNMIRFIIGSIIQFLQGKIKFSVLKDALRKNSKQYWIHKAPPQGLYLNKIKYTK